MVLNSLSSSSWRIETIALLISILLGLLFGWHAREIMCALGQDYVKVLVTSPIQILGHGKLMLYHCDRSELFMSPFITWKYVRVEVGLTYLHPTKSNAEYKIEKIKCKWHVSCLRKACSKGARLGINPSDLGHHIWAKKRKRQEAVSTHCMKAQGRLR